MCILVLAVFDVDGQRTFSCDIEAAFLEPEMDNEMFITEPLANTSIKSIICFLEMITSDTAMRCEGLNNTRWKALALESPDCINKLVSWWPQLIAF